jgi:drug/metabolite transporter (DMT)-like permease
LAKTAHSVTHGYWPDLSLFLSTIIWGLSFTVMKGILDVYISITFFVFLRFTISAVLLFIIGRKQILSMPKSGIKAGIFLGILEFAGFYTQTLGITHTTASKSAFITGLSSALIPVYLFIHKRKLPEPLVLLALILAVFGMYLLTGPAGGGFNIGDFLTVLCAIFFGAQIYVMGQATAKYNSIALVFFQILTTAAIAVLLLPTEEIHFTFAWKFIGALFFMIVFATTLALWVQGWAQKRTSAVRTGLIFSAEPVFAYFFAFAILGERFNTIQKVGGAIIILAILASELIPYLHSQKREKSGLIA